MSIPTINLGVTLAAIVGTALPNASVALTLTRADIVNDPGGALVPKGRTIIACDPNGLGSASIFPNALGTQGTGYLVEVFDQQGALVFTGRTSLPAQDCQLHNVLFTIPPMTQSDADAAILKARQWASQDTTPVETTPTPLYSAKYYALQGGGSATLSMNWAQFIGGDVPTAPAGSRSSHSWAQEDLRGATYAGSARDWAMGMGLIDGVTYFSARKYAVDAGAAATQTALDRVQTGLDRAQADADVISTSGSAANALSASLTAVAQAAMASVFALSAASVAQQDLSGITAAALHRSPNVVVVSFPYKTWEDPDGGAWVEKCQHTSWYNETLNGPWIPHPTAGGIPTEAVARALGGTLGANLIAAANGTVAGWTTTGTLSMVGTARMRVTNVASAAAANWTVALTAGKVYLLTSDILQGTASAPPYVRASNDGGGTWTIIPTNTNTSGSAVFVAPTTATYIFSFYNPGTATAGLYFDVGNFGLREITAWAASGTFYPNATDGKFYRLWKNLLSSTDDLTNGPVWLRNNVNNNTAGSIVPGQADTIGGTGAFKLIPANGAVSSYFNNTGVAMPVTGVQNTLWGVVKADGFNYCQVATNTTGGGGFVNGTAVFDLTGAGAVFSSAGADLVSASIAAVPGQAGWFVISMIVTPPAATSIAPYWRPFVSGSTSATGDGVSGVRLFRPQIDIGGFTASQIVAASTVYEGKTGADTSKTETFNGNTAKPPRLPMLVGETDRIIVYDALSPGRPMWKVFAPSAVSGSIWPGTALSGLVAIAGHIYVANNFTTQNTGGVIHFDLVKDVLERWPSCDPNAAGRMPGGIAKRNSNAQLVFPNALPGASNYSRGQAIAACILQDAPVDPVTGMQVPLVTIATAGGVAIVKPDGSLVLPLGTPSNSNISVSPYVCFTERDGTAVPYYLLQPGKATSSSTFSILGNGSAPDVNVGSVAIFGHAIAGRGSYGALRQGGIAQFLRLNETTPADSIAARVTGLYSTGQLRGDIRRCYLSEVLQGALSGINKVVNGTFPDTTGWTAGANTTLSSVGGQAKALATAIGGAFFGQNLGAFSAGQTVLVFFDSVSDGTSIAARAIMGTAIGSGDLFAGTTVAFGAGRFFSFTFPNAVASCWLWFWGAGSPASGSYILVDNVVTVDAIPDRSYKASALQVFGTGLSKAAVALGAQLMAITGFSGTSYLREAFSADHDYGTGPWSHRPWVSLPAGSVAVAAPAPGGVGSTFNYLPLANFAVSQNIAVNFNTADWTKGTGWSASSSSAAASDGTQVATSDLAWVAGGLSTTNGVARKWTVVVGALSGGTLTVYPNGGAPFTITAVGTYTGLGGAGINGNTGVVRISAGVTCSITLQVDELEAAPIVNRAAAAGARMELGVNIFGNLVGTAFDGTTTRRVTTTVQFLGMGFVLAELCYGTSGTLTLRVNGGQVGQSTGAPLLTMNNASAVLTIGSNFGLTSWFPGSISLTDLGADSATDDSSRWMFEQEKEMFREGAQVTLPDSGTQDLDYDPQQDKWVAVSATNESAIVGMVRVSSAPTPAGSFSRISQRSGVKLQTRTGGAIPGVDVTINAQNLKEELMRRGEDAAKAARPNTAQDWMGTFTANVLNTSALVTVTGNTLVIPPGGSIIGAAVSGTGIPASTVVLDYLPATNQVQLSKAATATNVGVTISLKDFFLPTGQETTNVRTNGAASREGASFIWTRSFNGFREGVSYGSVPGNQWIQLDTRKMT